MSTACFLSKPSRAAFPGSWSALLDHPQMAIYGAGVGMLVVFESRSSGRPRLSESAPVLPALLLPFLIGVPFYTPLDSAYREVLASRAYFLVTTWHSPPPRCVGTAHHLADVRPPGRLKSTLPAFSRLAKILVGLGLISVVAGAAPGQRCRFRVPVANVTPLGVSI